MRIIVKAGVCLLVSSVIILGFGGGCGKREMPPKKWEDKELSKILVSEPTDIVLTPEQKYELENYAAEQSDDDDFWCDC